MKCPICGQSDTKVVDSRNSGNLRRRRRLCMRCDFKFSTTELPGNCKEEELPLFADQHVRKSNGKTERYDPVKLRSSIAHATRRSDLSSDAADAVCEKVNALALKSGEGHVATADIKRWVISALLKASRDGAQRYAAAYLDAKEMVRHRIAFDKRSK